MKELGVMEDAWLLIDGDCIGDFGKMDDLDSKTIHDQAIDVHRGAVLPCWCDPHTHLVYAGSREGEFVDKIQGLSYEEIARRGGGILNSADLLHEMTEEELYQAAMNRLDEMVATGTGCVEIKSGYGLNTDDELKILRVIRRMKQTSNVRIVSTFLGAHAVGRAYTGRQEAYVDLVVDEMIPAVAEERLADFIDVFCDRGSMPANWPLRAVSPSGWSTGRAPSITWKVPATPTSPCCAGRPPCPPCCQAPRSSST